MSVCTSEKSFAFDFDFSVFLMKGIGDALSEVKQFSVPNIYEFSAAAVPNLIV